MSGTILLTSLLLSCLPLAEPEMLGVDGDVLLKHIAVDAEVLGRVAEVRVRQTFTNTLTQPLEALYLFPLPEDAAVHEMVMHLGERTVRAEIDERQSAQARYQQARSEGRVAALLDQERPNVFTQSVANIPPGQTITVEVAYTRALDYHDGRYHFHHPLVVGPRFLPLPTDPAQAEGFSRITAKYLKDGQSAPYTFDFAMHIDAGMPIVDLRSPSHALEVTSAEADPEVTLTLPPGEDAPDRDVVVTYALSSGEPEMGLLIHQPEEEGEHGYFSLLLEPPPAAEAAQSPPRELVFLLDTSGSMRGEPIAASQALMHHALDRMRPDDHFRILRFSDSVSALSEIPLGYSDRKQGHDYVDQLSADGGTYMERGIEAALAAPPDGDRLRIVLLLTDGFIGHEAVIFQRVCRDLGSARLFGLGVGSSTNRYLLEHLADYGRGATHYLRPGNDPTPAIEAFYQRIDIPVLTDIQIDWGGAEVERLSHWPPPDLFAGTPLTISGRFRSLPSEGQITVRARRGREAVSFTAPMGEATESGEGIARVWARAQIDRIERRAGDRSNDQARAEILPLALGYGLMSRYTSLVAVDDSGVVYPPGGVRSVPLPLPEGVTQHAVPEFVYVPRITVEEVIEQEQPWGENELGRIVEHRIVIRDPLLFEAGSTVIKPESLPTLRYVLRLIQNNDRIGHVSVDGYAMPGEADPYALSTARARVVWETLVLAGISPGRLSYRGMGIQPEGGTEGYVALNITHQYGELEITPPEEVAPTVLLEALRAQKDAVHLLGLLPRPPEPVPPPGPAGQPRQEPWEDSVNYCAAFEQE